MARTRIHKALKNKIVSISLPVEYVKWIEGRKKFNLSKFISISLGEYINKIESSEMKNV